MSTHKERVAELRAAIKASSKEWRLEVGSDINPVYATRTLRSGRLALICGHTTGEWSVQTEVFRIVTTAVAAIKIMDDYEADLP